MIIPLSSASADARHDLWCGSRETINAHAAGLAVAASLAVTAGQPVSLGGKGTGENNNQFHGSLDDVWISVG
jgi:hypothetical protein